jgi:hypothetical protein
MVTNLQAPRSNENQDEKPLIDGWTGIITTEARHREKRPQMNTDKHRWGTGNENHVKKGLKFTWMGRMGPECKTVNR